MSVQEALTLGAVDLKRTYNRNLAIAFLIALFFHVTLLGSKYVFDIFSSGSNSGEEAELIATGPVTLDDFKEEVVEEAEAPIEQVLPPPPPMSAAVETGTGSEGRMGNLVATNDDLVEGPDISDMSEIEFSDAVGGGSGDAEAFDPSAIELPTEIDVTKPTAVVEEKDYGIDDFVPEATPPAYNRADLRDLIEYPTIARENGIEGTVTVGVQVSKTGKPLQVIVRNTTNQIFNESATSAVRKLRFSPAVQNGHAIKMWLTFRVDFELN